MPLYEYRCDKCAKTFEVIQKFSDNPLDTCPDCGASVERLISRTSFQLKGNGWYASDYKKGGVTSPPVTAPAANSAPAAAESKTETTPTKVAAPKKTDSPVK